MCLIQQEVQSQLGNANSLLAIMSRQRQRWNEQLKAIWNTVDSVPGHALLCAASLHYLSRIPPDKHEELIANWVGYCSGVVSLGSLVSPEQQKLQSSQLHHGSMGQQQVVKIEKSFAVREIVSSKEERAAWEQDSVFPDEFAMERCLLARGCCVEGGSWPLILDPHAQFSKYLKALEPVTKHSKGGLSDARLLADEVSKPEDLMHATIHTSDPTLATTLNDILSIGGIVHLIIDSLPKQHIGFLKKLLQCKSEKRSLTGEMCLKLEDTVLWVHPQFRLYIAIEQPLAHAVATLSFMLDLSQVSFIDLSLCGTSLQSFVKGFILRHERPEFGIRNKSLLADLALHQQQIEQSQVL